MKSAITRPVLTWLRRESRRVAAVGAVCAVAEPHAKYTGETRFPLIIQNTHRYFFYIAALISVINTYDAIRAFHGKDGGFGIGLGTLMRFVLYRTVVFGKAAEQGAPPTHRDAHEK